MKKVCKKCKIFVTGNNCPNCGGTQLTENWKGRVVVFNAEDSIISKKMGIKNPGAYAIKTR